MLFNLFYLNYKYNKNVRDLYPFTYLVLTDCSPHLTPVKVQLTRTLLRDKTYVEVLGSLMGGLGGKGGSLIGSPGRDTICPITLSILSSFKVGSAGISSESAEEGGDGPLPSLPLSPVPLLRKMGSL